VVTTRSGISERVKRASIWSKGLLYGDANKYVAYGFSLAAVGFS
jgi:hypothetical protein